MIQHILLVKQLPGIDNAGRNEFQTATASLAAVEGVLEMTWGADTSGRAKGYTHAAVLRFADAAALQRYATHPDHLRIVETLPIGP
jgi:Stress responsive A/B Barrel Domain